jgi:hypothetical protein
MRVNDAARDTGSWGIGRIRAIVPGAALIDYGYGSRKVWVPWHRVEWLHHVDRWADDYFPTT